MKIRNKLVALGTGAALLFGGLVTAPGASAYPGAPRTGVRCAQVNFERHAYFYRYYHKVFDSDWRCRYTVGDYLFIGAKGKFRSLPDVYVYKRF